MPSEAPVATLMPVRVAAREQIAQDIHLFDLAPCDGCHLPRFEPGAHVAVRAPNGEIRKYSLCNDSDEEDRYAVAIKREHEGRGGSIGLIDATAAGDRWLISPPVNNFPLHPRAPGFLFIAGGIGISPIMSMIRYLRATAGKRFKLVYCTRSPQATAFRAELGAPELRGQVNIHHDDGDPARALDLWPLLERPTGAHLYCCGPRGMMQAVRDMTGHWSASAVHFESFADAAATRRPDDAAFSVRLARSGGVVEIPPDRSILETLRAHGHALASSCESGSCGTCRTRLIGGEADHRDLVLSDGERPGHIMICVSRARSPELVLDL
jgi:phthalate 4,5-dioxygenase reductase component